MSTPAHAPHLELLMRLALTAHDAGLKATIPYLVSLSEDERMALLLVGIGLVSKSFDNEDGVSE